MRILIVEDDMDTSQLLFRYLEPLGECDVSVNGKEAVKAFRKSFRENYPFDLVCLDIMMPHMNGHQTLQEIRNIEKKEAVQAGEGTKILMISVLSDDDTILKSFMQLCDGYVVKPIIQEELLKKLEEIDLINGEGQS